MEWIEWLRAPDGPLPESSHVELDVAALAGQVLELATTFRGREMDQPLVLARLADAWRDLGLAPPQPSDVREALSDLSTEDWRRLGLFVEIFRTDAGLAAAGEQIGDDALDHLVDVVLPSLTACSALTVDVVSRSPVRCEEQARRFVATLGARVAGESDEEAFQRLLRLDYGRLISIVDG